MRIAEYKQIDTQIVEDIVTVDVYDELGITIIGTREEVIRKEVPIMGMVYRDATPEEEAQAQAELAEMERMEALREPTAEERIEAQVMYTALMTDTLLMED